MAYDYPAEFSIEDCARIDGEKIRVTRAFRVAKRTHRSGRPIGDHLAKVDAMIILIATLAVEFGIVACEQGDPNRILFPGRSRWTVDKIEKETIRFVHYVGAELFSGLMRMDATNSDGLLKQEYLDRIQESEIWDRFEQMRTDVADAQSQQTSLVPAPIWNDAPAFPLPPSLLAVPRSLAPTAVKLKQLRADSRLTIKQVAELLHDADKDNQWAESTVYRHETGDMTPQPWRVSIYERVWSKFY